MSTSGKKCNEYYQRNGKVSTIIAQQILGDMLYLYIFSEISFNGRKTYLAVFDWRDFTTIQSACVGFRRALKSEYKMD